VSLIQSPPVIGPRSRRALRRITSGARTAGLNALAPLAVGLLPAKALAPLRRFGLDPAPPFDGDPAIGPIHRLPAVPWRRLWLVTGDAESRAVLADTEAFSNDFANLHGGLAPVSGPGGLGFADPPDHTRMRKLLTPEFTRAGLAAFEPSIAAIVDDQLDVLAGRGADADLWTDFALPIPTRTICGLLGLPERDWARYQRLSCARFDLGRGAGNSLGAVSEALDLLTEEVRAQRSRPGDGLLGRIIAKHGDDVTDRELAGLADGVLTGGLESTASMLALGSIALLRDPGLAGRVRRADAEDATRCVDELLRYLSVVQVAFLRFARRDVEVGGQPVRRGDVVACSLVAANRGPEAGACPHAIDPDRSPNRHLAFGFGAHRCLGAELARMELRIAYPALLRRFPDLRLAVPEAELRFRRASIVYGLDRLPVRLGEPA
jgi:cytochrome P450